MDPLFWLGNARRRKGDEAHTREMIELIKRLLIRFLEWLVSTRPTPSGTSYDPQDLMGASSEAEDENNDRRAGADESRLQD